MNYEQAKHVSAALNPHMEPDFAVGVLEQTADEINCIQQALSAGAIDSLICNALIGVEARLRVAAGIARDNEEPEVQP